jgi:hypothetical protein
VCSCYSDDPYILLNLVQYRRITERRHMVGVKVKRQAHITVKQDVVEDGCRIVCCALKSGRI